MSFIGKSNWLVGVLSLVFLIIYGRHLKADWIEAGGVPMPDSAFIIGLGVKFTIAMIIGYIILGIVFYKDADAGEDERDRAVIFKAGGFSGAFLGFVIVGGIWFSLRNHNSDIMVHAAIIGLILATFANCVLSLVLYRGDR